jgi:hypothetical protein
MTKQELEQQLKALRVEHDAKREVVMRKFCDANNPYKIGDTFTDHIGGIVIEKIGYHYSNSDTPCCIYIGLELKKDGTPKKGGKTRNAYQLNDITS